MPGPGLLLKGKVSQGKDLYLAFLPTLHISANILLLKHLNYCFIVIIILPAPSLQVFCGGKERRKGKTNPDFGVWLWRLSPSAEKELQHQPLLTGSHRMGPTATVQDLCRQSAA